MDNNLKSFDVDLDAKTITIGRVFDAVPGRLWRIITDPALVPSWFGPRALSTRVEAMDVRPGGRWRWLNRFGDGKEFALSGEYQIVEPHARLVQTVEFEGGGDVVIDTYLFEALPDGNTRLAIQSQYVSIKSLESSLKGGAESGVNEMYDRLGELLA